MPESFAFQISPHPGERSQALKSTEDSRALGGLKIYPLQERASG
jgi:hypothetical protein